VGQGISFQRLSSPPAFEREIAGDFHSMIIANRHQVFFSLAVLPVLACLLPARVAAQSTEQARLAAPADRTVPGFSVLDASLMSIEHINPLHATSITLFSTLRNNDLLPRDIAFEHLPWLSPPTGSATTILDQYARLAQPGLADTVLRYAAVSLAISQDVNRIGIDEPLSQVSIGLRTFVRGGRFNSRVVSLVEKYRAASAELDRAERQLDQEPERNAPIDGAEDQLAKLFVEARVLFQQIAAADKNRVGFLLETGVAQALEVPRNTLSDAQVARRAAWIGPIYRVERLPVDVAGLIRFIDERQTRSNTVDFGGRVGARRNDVLFSLEALGRRRFVTEHVVGEDLLNARVVGAITYGFNASTQVTFTFGKNYKNDFSRGGSLLASFGLTIGLGERTLGVPPDGE
jgi:hypothetical protein